MSKEVPAFDPEFPLDAAPEETSHAPTQRVASELRIEVGSIVQYALYYLVDRLNMRINLCLLNGTIVSAISSPVPDGAAHSIDFKVALVSARIDPDAVTITTPDSGHQIWPARGDDPVAWSGIPPYSLIIKYNSARLPTLGAPLRFGVHPLHLAIRLGAPAEELIAVIKSAPEVALIQDPRSGFPLYTLLRKPSFPGIADVVSCLLEAAPAALRQTEGEDAAMPLHIACRHGASVDIIRLLLNPPSASEGLLSSAVDRASRATPEGMLPLHEACRAHASSHVLHALLAAHSPAAAAVDSAGNTPLHWLLRCDRRCWPVAAASIRILLAAAPSSALARNKDGLLPLHLAAGCDAEGIAVLLEAGPAAAADTGSRGSPNRRFALQRVLADAATPRILRAIATAARDGDGPEAEAEDEAEELVSHPDWRAPALLALLHASPAEALCTRAGAGAGADEIPLLHAAVAIPGVPLGLIRAILDKFPPSARRLWHTPAERLELPAGLACLASPCRGDVLELLLDAGEVEETVAENGAQYARAHGSGELLASDGLFDIDAVAAADDLRAYRVPHAELARRLTRVAALPPTLQAIAMHGASASLVALIAAARRNNSLESVPWSILLRGKRPWPAADLTAALRERAARRRMLIVAARDRVRTVLLLNQ